MAQQKLDGSQLDESSIDSGSILNSGVLSDLSDVGTSDVTGGNVLVADGGDYKGRALVETDISDFGSYETAFSKNTAFNKNFAGTGAATTPARSDHNHDATYVEPADYATTSTGGTLKVRVDGTTAYFTINGVNA
jgi:hypothetical protein